MENKEHENAVLEFINQIMYFGDPLSTYNAIKEFLNQVRDKKAKQAIEIGERNNTTNP